MKPTTLIANRSIHDFSINPILPRLQDNLRVGDVILTVDATDVVRPIVYFQNQYPEFPAASRKFTHAALYIGEGEIVHAIPEEGWTGIYYGMVKRERITDLLSDGTTFAVLRARIVVEDHHEAIIAAACSHIGDLYDYRAIHECIIESSGRLGQLVRSVRGAVDAFVGTIPGLAQSAEAARAFVCSDFVYVVLDEVFGVKNPCNYAGGNPAPIFMPCALYACPNLYDVDLGS